MFFNRNKTKINEYNRSKILQKIAELSTNCSNSDLRAQLSAIRDNINSHMASSSPEVFMWDAKILRYLAAIQNDIQLHGWHVAEIRMESVMLALNMRSEHGTGANDILLTRKDRKIQKRAEKELNTWYKKNSLDEAAASFTVDDLYQTNDLYRMQIAGLQDAILRDNEKIASLNKKLERNPYDRFILSEMDNVQEHINGIQDLLDAYGDERLSKTYLQNIGTYNSTKKQLIADRPYSEEATRVLFDEYNHLKESKPVLPSDGRGRSTYGGSNRVENSSVGANPYAQQAKLKRELAEIKQAVTKLEQNEENFRQKLEDYAFELREVDAELKALLEKRRGLSSSQRLTFDGEIDSLNAKRNRILQSAKRINQARSINTDKLSLIASKKQQLELAESGELSGLNIGDFDFEQIALELRDAAEKGNEELEKIGTAYIVGNSVDIRSGAMSGTNQVDSESVGEFGDSKYADLEKELGLTSKED